MSYADEEAREFYESYKPPRSGEAEKFFLEMFPDVRDENMWLMFRMGFNKAVERCIEISVWQEGVAFDMELLVSDAERPW
jgi:hypothetical protein